MLQRLAAPEKNVEKNQNVEIIKINFANLAELRCFGTTMTN
jgi:hypothetical protein